MRLLLVLALLTSLAMAQKIPVDTFTFHGQVWKLETVVEIIDGDCTSAWPCYGMTYCGRFSDDHKRHLVRVVWVAPEWESQQVIVFHELQHVVEGCTDLKTTQHHAIYDISQPMMELLRDPRNRELTKWLFESEAK